MSWITKLNETYDNCSSVVGKPIEDLTLLPIAHSTQNAQIEIVIDKNGNFLRANIVDKEDNVTVIPVTEDSSSRSNGISPHPLCDKLIYVAGDLEKYIEKNCYQYHQVYMDALKKWCQSPYRHEKIVAIYEYLNKETVISDLCNANVLLLTEDNILDDKTKIATIAQTDAFIRFVIEEVGNSEQESCVWKDKEVYDSFLRYYMDSFSEKDLCYVSGEYTFCSEKHPSKIRHTGDKSKLISANDTSGILFRGRFDKKEEANSISYEVSQKAHNALKWLIKKQGFSIGEMVFLAWGTQSVQIPNILKDTVSIWDSEELNMDLQNLVSEKHVETEKIYANKLSQAIFRDNVHLNENENVVCMMLEAATTGRLAITYYKELNGSEFYKNLVKWHQGCEWMQRYKVVDSKLKPFIGAPALRDIISTVWGVEQKNFLVVKDNIEKSAMARLLPCIIEGRQIPFDIVRKSVLNASKPMGYSKFNRGKILSISCSLIKKYYNDKVKKEEWSMALQEERTDRDYLYGRLLALAQKVEMSASKNFDRDTNAERYMSAFQKHPCSTWVVITKKLQPYLKSLGNKGNYYKRKMAELIDQFEVNQFENNKALSGTYLLGYSSQMNDRNKTKQEEEN